MMKIKLLLYCTKAKPYLTKDYDMFGDFVKFKTTNDLTNSQTLNGILKYLNGKIVAECECDKVEVFTIDYRGDKSQNKRIEKDSCLDLGDLIAYQKENPFLYAPHLSNLKIFDKPRELNDFFKDIFPKLYEKWEDHRIKKAPQNMCYCYDEEGNKYILISIQPQHLVNILNVKKTIEIRKQILNCLKELI